MLVSKLFSTKRKPEIIGEMAYPRKNWIRESTKGAGNIIILLESKKVVKE